MKKKYSNKRPNIPAEIERLLKVEASHTCQIFNCSEHTYLEIHHVNGDREDNNINNLILLCDKHHKMAHSGIIDRKALLLYKKKTQVPDYNILKNLIDTSLEEKNQLSDLIKKIKELLTVKSSAPNSIHKALSKNKTDDKQIEFNVKNFEIILNQTFETFVVYKLDNLLSKESSWRPHLDAFKLIYLLMCIPLLRSNKYLTEKILLNLSDTILFQLNAIGEVNLYNSVKIIENSRSKTQLEINKIRPKTKTDKNFKEFNKRAKILRNKFSKIQSKETEKLKTQYSILFYNHFTLFWKYYSKCKNEYQQAFYIVAMCNSDIQSSLYSKSNAILVNQNTDNDFFDFIITVRTETTYIKFTSDSHDDQQKLKNKFPDRTIRFIDKNVFFKDLDKFIHEEYFYSYNYILG